MKFFFFFLPSYPYEISLVLWVGYEPVSFVLYCRTHFLRGRGTTTIFRFVRFPSKEVTDRVAMAPAAAETHAGCCIGFSVWVVLIFWLFWNLTYLVLPICCFFFFSVSPFPPRFVFVCFVFFFGAPSFNVFGLLACVCCACSAQHDGVALPCLSCLRVLHDDVKSLCCSL